MDEFTQLLLGPLGTLVLALFIIFSGWKCWWVPGWLYKSTLAEKEEWKEAALRGTRVAERAVSIHEAHERRDVRAEERRDEESV